MIGWKAVRLGCVIVSLLVLCGIASCGAYVRFGTTVIEDFPSPDAKYVAVLLVRNGGAMTGYATAISVVRANWLARELALWALYRPAHVFVADDNNGKVACGSQGQINVKVRWASTAKLVVTYPDKTRILRAQPRVDSVDIRYALSE